MFRHLNLRLRKQDAPGGHVGVSLHLGRPEDPVAYSGLLEVEIDGVRLSIRCQEDGSDAAVTLEAAGGRLELQPEGLRRLIQREAPPDGRKGVPAP